VTTGRRIFEGVCYVDRAGLAGSIQGRLGNSEILPGIEVAWVTSGIDADGYRDLSYIDLGRYCISGGYNAAHWL
jgi:hypothetical protein